MGHVLLGVVIGAYGVRGQLRIRSFTEEPCDIGRYGILRDKAGVNYRLSGLRLQRGDIVIGSISTGENIGENIGGAIKDREQAQSLRGLELFIERSALQGHSGEEDSYYHFDLIGLSVCGESGDIIGSVVGVYNYGGGDLLDIKLSSGGSVLILFSKANVLSVVLGERIILSAVALRELSGDVVG